VDPNANASVAQASPAAGAQRTYTVQPGDTLSKISKEVYGKPAEYMKIFDANRDVLSDPNKINPGQTLKIPA
jgi:nucleoid-associated protein YgaU